MMELRAVHRSVRSLSFIYSGAKYRECVRPEENLIHIPGVFFGRKCGISGQFFWKMQHKGIYSGTGWVVSREEPEMQERMVQNFLICCPNKWRWREVERDEQLLEYASFFLPAFKREVAWTWYSTYHRYPEVRYALLLLQQISGQYCGRRVQVLFAASNVKTLLS